MKYKLTGEDKGINIRIDDVGANRDALLEAFQECQQGRCSCPTQEYRKLQSLNIEDSGETLSLQLESKPGEKLDADEISRCLDYTLDKAEGDRDEQDDRSEFIR